MNTSFQKILFTTLLFVGFFMGIASSFAQKRLGPGAGLGNIGRNTPNQTGDIVGNDTSNIFSKKKQWNNPRPVIHYKLENSAIENNMDTAIDRIHRVFSSNPYIRHIGNMGQAALNWKFTTKDELGPRLDYAAYDNYHYHFSALPYFNTTRPYSRFDYSLGSKQEQFVSIVHTQNVDQNWNFAFNVSNINSEGFYSLQQAIYNGGFITSNFMSKNQKYTAKLGIIYNKNKADENGGITADSLLTNTRFINKKQIPTNFTAGFGSNKYSLIRNTYQQIDAQFIQDYGWGKTDTLYNEDSTSISRRFTPRFKIKHRLNLINRKHGYRDQFPNAATYIVFNPNIGINLTDTLNQKLIWTGIHNQFSFNGYVGKPEQLLQLEAGIQNKLDIFKDKIKVNDKRVTYVNNLIYGILKKEALTPYQWSYGAFADFYFAGSSIGDFKVGGHLSKKLKNIGGFRLAARQLLKSNAYNYQRHATNYFVLEKNDLKKEAYTHLEAAINISKIGLTLKGSNYIVSNYIYLDSIGNTQQLDQLFNVTQLSLSHDMRTKNFVFNSDLLFQKAVGNHKVNLPTIMFRHLAGWNTKVFKKKLNLFTGLEVKYYTPFQNPHYNPFINQFTYNSTTQYNNVPELAAFANIKVKNLRFFAMGDQLQQLLFKKNVIHYKGYPMTNALFRFGFNWELFN